MKREWIPRLVAAGLVLALVFLWQVLTPSLLRAYHTSRAEADMDAGRYQNAITHLEWLYARSPGDADLCLWLTDAYLADGNTGSAESTLTRGIDAGVGQLTLYKRLCAVYLLQDKLLDAVSFLDGLPNPLVKERLDAMRPAAPVLAPPPGRYEEAISLGIDAPEGGGCYLSLSGEIPSMLTDVYTNPRELTAGLTAVKAVIVVDGLPSAWTTGTYRLENIVQPMVFADPEVEKRLRDNLQNPNEPVISTDLWEIGSLAAGAEPAHYTSLADLAHLQGLTELALYGDGSKVDITPLAALTGLKKLSLRQFALDDNDLGLIAQWAWLEELALPDNRIASLDTIATLTRLTALDLSGNNITDVSPLSDMIQLRRLDFSRNAVRSTAPLATLSALTELSLSENQVTDLRGLRTLVRLSNLDISYNKVTDLSPLASHAELVTLIAKNCPVRSLSPLSDCAALETLTCTGGTIQSVEPLTGLTALRELYLDGNQLETLSGLEGCAALSSLWINGNRLATLAALSGLRTLQTVSVENNRLTSLEDLKTCPALQGVYAFGNPLDERTDILEGNDAVIYYEQAYFTS